MDMKRAMDIMAALMKNATVVDRVDHSKTVAMEAILEAVVAAEVEVVHDEEDAEAVVVACENMMTNQLCLTVHDRTAVTIQVAAKNRHKRPMGTGKCQIMRMS